MATAQTAEPRYRIIMYKQCLLGGPAVEWRTAARGWAGTLAVLRSHREWRLRGSRPLRVERV